MLTLLYRSAAVWTIAGLLGGLYYREFTKSQGHPGGTQLALVHTHALALGTIMGLVLLALAVVLPELARDRRFVIGAWAWQAGLAITVGTLAVKGTLQVLKDAAADSPALAGIAGLGHLTLTVAFLLLFVALGAVVKTRSVDARSEETSAAGAPPAAARPGERPGTATP